MMTLYCAAAVTAAHYVIPCQHSALSSRLVSSRPFLFSPFPLHFRAFIFSKMMTLTLCATQFATTRSEELRITHHIVNFIICQ